jgi:hypothetical protein
MHDFELIYSERGDTAVIRRSPLSFSERRAAMLLPVKTTCYLATNVCIFTMPLSGA